MRLMVGNEDVSKRIISKVGLSKLILFKSGKGSGGDLLLKQMFENVPEGTNSIFISTHQTEGELMEDLLDLGIERQPELISLLPVIDLRLSEVAKRDRFINEGIMVTDLLEISSYSSDRPASQNTHMKVLSTLSDISSKQVLPFRMVIDTLVDLVEESSPEEIIDRLRILKRSIRENQGLVIVGCPQGYDVFQDLEQTLFDVIIEVKAEKRGEAWFRTLSFAHIKGSGEPPEEWQISTVKDIPTALSVD
ncbi:MAG: hypothetical protein ACMUHM_00635 [Thermoplasmatota archaeon]